MAGARTGASCCSVAEYPPIPYVSAFQQSLQRLALLDAAVFQHWMPTDITSRHCAIKTRIVITWYAFQSELFSSLVIEFKQEEDFWHSFAVMRLRVERQSFIASQSDHNRTLAIFVVKNDLIGLVNMKIQCAICILIYFVKEI